MMINEDVEQPSDGDSSDDLIDQLNGLYLAERQALVNYDAHLQAISDLGVRLGLEMMRDHAQEHAHQLAARIRQLGGTPTQRLVGVQPAGSTPQRMLAFDLAAKRRLIQECRRAIGALAGDRKTMRLLKRLLADELEQRRWLESAVRALGGATDATTDNREEPP